MAEEMVKRKRKFGSIILDTIKGNPIPTALTGVGIGWLVMKGLTQTVREEQESPSEKLSEPKDTVKQLVSSVQEKGRKIVSEAQEKGKEVGREAKEKLERLSRIAQAKTGVWEERFREIRGNRTLSLGAAALLGSSWASSYPEPNGDMS